MIDPAASDNRRRRACWPPRKPGGVPLSRLTVSGYLVGLGLRAAGLVAPAGLVAAPLARGEDVPPVARGDPLAAPVAAAEAHGVAVAARVVPAGEPLAAALGEPLRAGLLPLAAALPLAGALVAARAAGLLAAGEVADPVRGLPLAAGEVAAPLRAAVLVGLAADFVDVAQGERVAVDLSSLLPQATASARSPTETAMGTSATNWCRFIGPSFLFRLLSKYPKRTQNIPWYRLRLQIHNNQPPRERTIQTHALG